MITRGNREGELLFVTDEDVEDQEFTVRLRPEKGSAVVELKGDLAILTNDLEFLRVIDAKLSHIFTVLDLYSRGNRKAINNIEAAQQRVYDVTFAELLAMTEISHADA